MEIDFQTPATMAKENANCLSLIARFSCRLSTFYIRSPAISSGFAGLNNPRS